MTHDLLDLALLLQILQRLARQTAVDFQPVYQHRHRDQPVGLHIFVQFIRGRLVEDDGVVGLVLDCFGWSAFAESIAGLEIGRRNLHTFSLGPLLLLLLAAGG